MGNEEKTVLPILESKPNTNGNTTSFKSIGGLLLLIAAISGIYSMISPQMKDFNQKLLFMKEINDSKSLFMKEELLKANTLIRKGEKEHRENREMLVSLREKLSFLQSKFDEKNKLEKMLCEKYDKILTDYLIRVEKLEKKVRDGDLIGAKEHAELKTALKYIEKELLELKDKK